MLVTVYIRTDTEANHQQANLQLQRGEPVFADDIGRLKIGDGVHHYADLPSLSFDPAAVEDLTQAAIAAAATAVAARDTAVAAAGGASAATTSSPGVIQLATLADAQAGTAANLAITPATLAALLGAGATVQNASLSARGIAMLASVPETQAGTVADKIVTPAGLAAVLSSITPNVVTATTAVQGSVILATTAQVVSGTAVDRVVTPAGVTAAIGAIPSPSTTVRGLNRFATTIEAQEGLLDSVGMTPLKVFAAIAAALTESSVTSLRDVNIPERQVDDLGNVINEGPQDGHVLTWDADQNALALEPVNGGTGGPWQPYDPALTKWFVPQFVLDADNPTIPTDFPDEGIVHNQLVPDAPIVKSTLVIANTTVNPTIGDPVIYGATDITLTTATPPIGFPAAVRGAEFDLWVTQDATGGRVPTWPTAAEAETGGNLTPASGANTVTFYHFASRGQKWRCVNKRLFGAAVAPTATPPSFRGTPTAQTTGTSNALAQNTHTLPTGITGTDIGYALVVRDGIDPVAPATAPELTIPTGWTQLERNASGAMTTWLLRRSMTSGDSGTNTTFAFTGGNARVQSVVAVVKAGTTTGEVRQFASSAIATNTAPIPGCTPSADNSFVVAFTGVRFNTSTSPTIAPSDTTYAEAIPEVIEGRAAAVNFGVAIVSRTLTGQGGLAQPANSLALTGANATSHTYLVAIPPAA